MASDPLATPHLQSLAIKRRVLCEKVNTDGDLLTHLESSGVFTPEEAEKLRAEPSSRVRVGCIVDTLCKGTQKNFENFVKALVQTGQGHLAKFLCTEPGRYIKYCTMSTIYYKDIIYICIYNIENRYALYKPCI